MRHGSGDIKGGCMQLDRYSALAVLHSQAATAESHNVGSHLKPKPSIFTGHAAPAVSSTPDVK